MMKVDLVLPKQDDGRSRDKRGVIVSGTLAQLAAVTPDNIQLRCIDEFFDTAIPSRDVNLVGISVRTHQVRRAIEISQAYKGLGAKVVWGGIHPTALPQEKSPFVDCYVRGEAERTWPMLLRDFERGELKEEYRDETPVDVNDLPLPRRDLFKRADNPFVIESLPTSRGCIYDCEHCSATLVYGSQGIRFVNTDRVSQDLANISGRLVAVCDENIMNSRDRAELMFDVFAHSGKKFIVEFDPVSAKNPELAEKLKRAGVRVALIGFESVYPENFRGNRKYVPPNEWPRIVGRMHEKGIIVRGLFMFGLEHDDENVFDETDRLTREAGIDNVYAGILTPFPGTRLYRRLEREGRLLHKTWDKYDTKNVVFRPRNISPEVLQAKWDERYRRVL